MLTLARTAVLYSRPERETVARYAVPVYPFSADEMGRTEFSDDCERVTETAPPEPETIAFVFDYGNGKRTVENIPANRQAREAIAARQMASAEPETIAQQLHREIMQKQAEKRALLDELFSSHDWNTSPANWKPEAVLYYLEFVCGETVSHESKTGTDSITAENLSRAFFQFRQRNTETACATVPRVDLLNAVKNAKKLNPRSPAKTVSLRINGSLDVVTSDHTARFSQAVRYDSKAGDLRLTFPEQRLTAICTKLKSKTVELVLTSCEPLNEHVLTVKTDSAEFTIPVEIPNDGERFVSDFPATFAHNVKAGELLRAFKMTEFATCQETGRYALAGCFLQPGEDSLDIAATDSRRLSVETIPAEVLGAMPAIERGESRHPLGVVVPPGIVSLLMDELKRQPESAVVSFAVSQPIYITQILFPPANLSPAKQATWKPEPLANTEANANSVQFQDDNGVWLLGFTRREFVFELSGAFSIRGIPQEGRFPRYLDVIPRNFESAYVLNRAEFLNACETIILSTDEESRGVDFVFPDESEPLQISLYAKSATMGNATTKAPCVSVKSDSRHTVTLDPAFCIDWLKRATAEDILIQIQDSQTAILMSENSHTYRTLRTGSGVYVQMPLTPDR